MQKQEQEPMEQNKHFKILYRTYYKHIHPPGSSGGILFLSLI